LLGWLCGALSAVAEAGDLDAADLRNAAAYSAECRGFSLLVVQRGRTLLEEYPNGNSASKAHKIYSGTKAFWNLAALAAVEDGRLDLDERVSATLPEWRGDPRKARVTVRALLDFSSGLEPGIFLHGDGVRDRNRAAIDLPMVAAGGERFVYGPGAMQVFHEVLRRKLAPSRGTPTAYLERRVLAPLGLGPQRYLADRAGHPLLATGWQLTAREWAKIGRVVLAKGAPVLHGGTLSAMRRGSGANRAYALGWWNNRAAPGGREFDLEDMLERDWQRQDWHGAVICRDAPADLMASIGSGYQRLYVIPSLDLIVVRQGGGGRFSDARFLRLLLGR
jgi:CubicO group peptidase (beta-lactamase class C family)